MTESKIVLGSRSPRRRELLAMIACAEQIVICPPTSPVEPGFDDVTTEETIAGRLSEVVHLKHQDVTAQIAEAAGEQFVVVADTIVIVEEPGGLRKVLGQPSRDDWQSEVREWFTNWLSCRTHEVWTGIMVSKGPSIIETTVRSQVTFGRISGEMLDGYLATEESPGKAGGYAIQGHAAAFVTALTGSLTNVIGLPVMEVASSLQTLGWTR